MTGTPDDLPEGDPRGESRVPADETTTPDSSEGAPSAVSADDRSVTRLSRRSALQGLGLLGLGLGTARTAASVPPQSPPLVAQAVPDQEPRTIGNGTNAIHEGAIVFGDSSPREISSKQPDEVRSQMPIYAPAFHTTSARTAKTDVEPVDPEAILAGVESLSISRWRFSDRDHGQHVGPMAGEFQATFDLDESDSTGSTPDGTAETIATVDADGVALAAIQGLARRLETEHDRLQSALEDRRETIAALESRLDALEEEAGEQ